MQHCKILQKFPEWEGKRQNFALGPLETIKYYIPLKRSRFLLMKKFCCRKSNFRCLRINDFLDAKFCKQKKMKFDFSASETFFAIFLHMCKRSRVCSHSTATPGRFIFFFTFPHVSWIRRWMNFTRSVNARGVYFSRRRHLSDPIFEIFERIFSTSISSFGRQKLENFAWTL